MIDFSQFIFFSLCSGGDRYLIKYSMAWSYTHTLWAFVDCLVYFCALITSAPPAEIQAAPNAVQSTNVVPIMRTNEELQVPWGSGGLLFQDNRSFIVLMSTMSGWWNRLIIFSVASTYIRYIQPMSVSHIDISDVYMLYFVPCHWPTSI